LETPETNNLKSCCYCHVIKSYAEFPKHKNRKDGFGTACRSCMKEYHKKRSCVAANRIRANEITRNWRHVNGKTQYRKYRNKVRTYQNAYAYKKFGLTVEQYKELVITQKGLCAICHKPETRMKNGRTQRLSIDHNHVSGKVRGLLCGACNSGIGYFKDDLVTINSAISYLQQTNG